LSQADRRVRQLSVRVREGIGDRQNLFTSTIIGNIRFAGYRADDDDEP